MFRSLSADETPECHRLRQCGNLIDIHSSDDTEPGFLVQKILRHQAYRCECTCPPNFLGKQCEIEKRDCVAKWTVCDPSISKQFYIIQLPQLGTGKFCLHANNTARSCKSSAEMLNVSKEALRSVTEAATSLSQSGGTLDASAIMSLEEGENKLVDRDSVPDTVEASMANDDSLDFPVQTSPSDKDEESSLEEDSANAEKLAGFASLVFDANEKVNSFSVTSESLPIPGGMEKPTVKVLRPSPVGETAVDLDSMDKNDEAAYIPLQDDESVGVQVGGLELEMKRTSEGLELKPIRATVAESEISSDLLPSCKSIARLALGLLFVMGIV